MLGCCCFVGVAGGWAAGLNSSRAERLEQVEGLLGDFDYE